MRVLAVVNSLGFGGAERMLEKTVLALSETGHIEFTVCSLGEAGPIGQKLRSRGVEVVALGGRGGAGRVVVRGIVGIRRLLRQRRFDLIHSFLYRSHCAARLARVGLKQRTALISAEHCVGDNRSRGTLLLNRLMSRMSDRILAVSAAVGDRVVMRDRVPPDRVKVILNGIEIASPRPATGSRLRKCLDIAPSEVVFLVLGRLHHEKGADIFLQALGILAGCGAEGWRAVVVGDGPEREALSRLAVDLGVKERVFFAGERRRVGPWIEAADILILPSREEGLPVAPLEAMSRGKPVVATEVGGTPEAVRHGETGLLVPAEDPRALASALHLMLENSELRKRLGARGLTVLRAEFSIDRMVSEIVNMYEEVLGRPRSESGVFRSTASLNAAGD